mgnify:FL=1|tara:strand:- start:2150 stop:2353 length:204 start_codon:yes stop_codon:yes gene_type:complete
MSRITPDYDYDIADEYIKEDQLEVAVRALHVIAAMPSSEPEFLSSVALDALKEMETYGLMYDWSEDG